MSEKKSCFVVTPIGDENTAIRRHIDGIIDQAIIPAIGDEFEIKVAHREYEIGSINDRVIQNVYNSDLVVANLTGLNPNVMFEIAIRYSFGKPAIVIAENGTKLPFDIVDENTIFYINDPAGAAELKENIKKFVQKIDWTKCEYGPVFSAIKNAAVINYIESGISDKDNKNAFSFLAEKMSDLEAEIKRMKMCDYADRFSIKYNGRLNNDLNNLVEILKKHKLSLSKDGVREAIENFLKEESYILGLADTNALKQLLMIKIENDDYFSDESKNNMFKIIQNIK